MTRSEAEHAFLFPIPVKQPPNRGSTILLPLASDGHRKGGVSEMLLDVPDVLLGCPSVEFNNTSRPLPR